MRRILITIAAAALAVSGAAFASGSAKIQHKSWSFEGPFGTFDQAQLQRGYQVYNEVCSSCHAMNLLTFAALGQKDAPYWREDFPNPNDNPWVKAIAADHQVDFLDTDSGDMDKRAGTPADRFPSPFKNEYASRASNGGAYPPDLSVIIKARHDGPNYVYSILTGYKTPPAGLDVAENMYYNEAMSGDVSGSWHGDHEHVPPGGFIAMKPPLAKDKVTYDNGPSATVDQMARDVVTFMAWASDPKQTERKRVGLMVMSFLLLLCGITYLSYRKVWKNAH